MIFVLLNVFELLNTLLTCVPLFFGYIPERFAYMNPSFLSQPSVYRAEKQPVIQRWRTQEMKHRNRTELPFLAVQGPTQHTPHPRLRRTRGNNALTFA